jgi:hypothetical protein
MAKILKYGGGITLEQEEYAINGSIVDGTVVEFDTTNGGVKACTANAALKALAGMLEGQHSDALSGYVKAVVRPLIPGTIVEFGHAIASLKVGAPVAIAAGGATVAAAASNPEIGRVVEVVSATVCKVRIG